MDSQWILERERHWATPAATAAILALVLYVVSFVIDRSAGLYTGASDARQLASIHDHSATILVGSIVRAATFLLLPLPMLYLFRAAQARNPRVQAVMVGFVFIGPVLFAVQGVVQAKGAGDAASEFVTLVPASPPPYEPTKPYAAVAGDLQSNPKSIEKVTIYDNRALEVQRSDDTFYGVISFGKRSAGAVISDLPARLDKARVDHGTDSDTDSQPGDALATHLTDNSGAIQVAQALLFPAVLGLVVMMIYVPLQALRVGLLTRFFGSLGVALGASMILILPIALLGVLLWLGYLGLLIVGRVPGGRPPAWEAGEAIPWPRPGEAPAPPRAPDTVEGEASEVSGDEPGPASKPRSERQKRKRRR
jgi:hypothetical protein